MILLLAKMWYNWIKHLNGGIIMERYSRRNHAARRHHRVAKKEVVYSPQKSFAIPKNQVKKFAPIVVGALFIEMLIWFGIGFFIGRKTA